MTRAHVRDCPKVGIHQPRETSGAWMCERVRVCWVGVYGGVGIVPPKDRTPPATSLFHLISQPIES
jgi:hypothetical protein